MQSTKLSAALAVLCLLGAPAAMADCKSKPSETKLVKVTEGQDGNPIVSPDTMNACEGDVVNWVFPGGAKKFIVSFTGENGSPCEFAPPTGASVKCTIRSGAAQNGQSTPYDYDVGFEGGPAMDPTIIIDP